MKVLHFKTVPSTNAIAKKYKKAPWTVILADEQVSGYGKGKRFWHSPYRILMPVIPNPTQKGILYDDFDLELAKDKERFKDRWGKIVIKVPH